MFAAAWWSLFYPELCFTEETCETVQTVDTGQATGQTAVSQSREAEETGRSVPAQDAGLNMVSGIMRAEDDEIVISSRLLDWFEERLSDNKK